MSGADLSGADLKEANLQNARGITDERLAEAKTLEGPPCPRAENMSRHLL